MASWLRVEAADDIGDDVHDVAVALDDVALGDGDGADLGDAADVIAAKVEEHEVFGALLGVGKEGFGQGIVFSAGGAAPCGASDRADGDLAVTDANEDFRARADEGEVAELEVEEEGRGVGAAQGAVEREGGQREGGGEALREDDLEGIASGDVVLGALDHGHIFSRRRVRGGLGRLDGGVRRDGGKLDGAFEGADGAGEALGGSGVGIGRRDVRGRGGRG